MRILFFTLVIYVTCSIALAQQPQAQFQAGITSGCAPLVVNFQNLSTGYVSSQWITGAGNSSLANPGIFYPNPGTFDVTLIVTSAQGLKDTLTLPDYIHVYAYPVAQFSASATQVCAHEPVSFTDFSSPGSGNIISRVWDFGDGDTSHLPNPSHAFTEPGVYPISLVVENQYGCSDNIVYTSYITVGAPDPAFSGDNLVGCGPPLQVQFTAATSGVQHFWDFGDGTTSGAAAPSHTYTSFGAFTVMHITIGSDGCRDTLIKPTYINIGVNTLGISAQSQEICMNDTVFFHTNAASNAIVQWQFGDGSSGLGLSPSHIYYTPGSYQATATISDVSGCATTLSLPITVHSFPTTDFTTAGPTSACEAPFTVNFLHQSSGGTSFYWEFGDGYTSNLPNPSHTYTSIDSFDVRLIVTGVGGCPMAKRKNSYIKIEPLKTRFTASVRGGCAPLMVVFDDTTHSPSPIVSWQWDFGDGGTSTLETPTYTYQDTGVYDVRLIVTNSLGCSDTLIKTNYISAGNLPLVNFVADTLQACALTEVHFTNLSQGASTYIWMFGDGDTAMSFNVSHGFAALGPVDVTLIGSDRGCRDTLFLDDYINVLAPLPLMGISDKQICTLPFTVQVENLSIGDDAWEWMIDGTIPISQHNFSYTFTTEGSHSVLLTVRNFFTGCVTRALDSILIKTVDAAIEPDDDRGCMPHAVQFTDRSTNAVKWWWRFGTGDSSIVKNPAYTYSNSGDYDVRLVVENSLRCRDTAYYHSIHSVRAQADFGVRNSPAGCLPLLVQFEDRSGGNSPVVAWNWSFGDGGTSVLRHPSHIYQQPSYYDVKLKVRNADGCTDSLTRSSFIFVTQPLPDFIVSPQINCPGTPSTFVSLASGAGLSYLWDFGDGNTSTLANPTHAYASEGDYTITLTVIDVNGCDSTLIRSNYVKIRELHAQFVADTTYASCPPLSVHFTADTDFIHPEVSWQWDFGNGATSSQESPTHVYTLPGLYDVTLILSTPTGCSDTLRFEELIEIEGPTAQFGFTPDQGCPGTEVLFTASSEETITYEWVFGDGNTGLGQNTTHTYTTPGLFTPVLVVQDSTGCRVFQVSPDQVRIFEPPVAAFSADEPRLCEPGVVNFTDLSQAAPGNQLLRWEWNFGNGLSDTLPSPSSFYGPVGDYSVWLAVTDQRGCSDTLLREGYVRVLLNVTPEPLPLRYVSVRNDTEIEVIFEPFANIRGDFGSYRIYRSESGGPWVLAGEVEDLATNHFTDKNRNTRHHVYCYKAEVVNFCGKNGGIDPVEAHCSINLESQAGVEEVQLNWTPYVGWTDVESYRLYRVHDYSGARSLVAVVPGTDTSFTDLDMYCYDTYTYRVEAVGRQYLSLSDTSFAAPGKRMPADPSHVVRATVENNEYVLLEWELIPVEDAKDVVVQRDEGFGYQEVMKQAFADPDLKFQDKTTRVDEKSYSYRVFVVDSCGDYAPVGRPGNSIYLQTRRVAGSIYLEWTPYEGWRDGVSSYKIELFNERTGNFEALAVLPGNEVQFVDQFSDLGQGVQCYRIWAYESGGVASSSLSNESCVVIEPQLFTANAFTPNGDGFNDGFTVGGAFLSEFYMAIYNRWGQKVFETRSLDDVWTGQTLQGGLAPEGVYVFKASGVGYEGSRIQRIGSVTLVR